MEKTNAITFRELIVVAILAAALLVPLAVRVDSLWPDHPAYSIPADHQIYIAMAQAPGGGHPPPFAYRILMPYAAALLPLEVPMSFYVLTILFLFGTAIFMYAILREMGASPADALPGIVLLFSLNWWAKFLEYYFWLTDSALIFCATAGLFFILRRRPLHAGVALGFAVLSKEAGLFLIPVYYAYHARTLWDPRAFKETSALAALPVAVFVGLRLWLPVAGPVYDPAGLFRDIGVRRLTSGAFDFLRGGTVGTWGVIIPVLAVAGSLRARRFARASAVLLALVYVQPLFALNLDRVLVYGLVCVIPLAVVGLRRLGERLMSGWMTWTLALIPYTLILIKENYQSPPPEQSLLAIALWLAVVVIARRSRRPAQGQEAPR